MTTSIDWIHEIDASLSTTYGVTVRPVRASRWRRGRPVAADPRRGTCTAYVELHGAEIRRLAHAICCDWGQAETLVTTLLSALHDHWHQLADDRAVHRFVCARLAAAKVIASATPRSCRTYGREFPMEDGSLLFDGLQSLSGAERKAVVLHDWLELPIHEVASLMSLPEETVRLLAASGRSALELLLPDSA